MKKPRILITAGPTREKIDPVRFITNYSTGEMGYAIARAAIKAGLETTLISGPVSINPPKGVKIVNIESGRELLDAVRRELKRANILFMTAAVCDYSPARATKKKLKRKGGVTLKLEQTEDILKAVARGKKDKLFVGFSLETENLIENSVKKLRDKGLDLIVGNLCGKKANPFGKGKTSVAIIGGDGRLVELEGVTKDKVAKELIALASDLYDNLGTRK